MSSKASSESARRLEVLRELLAAGEISTQEELVEELRAQKFIVTQSTISRDLSRLAAVKTRDATGRIVYRLPQDASGAMMPPPADFKDLIAEILHNGSMIVIKTSPGSASLVARQLDQTKPAGILGTLAGDDTIFVAPGSAKSIPKVIEAIRAQFI